VLVVILKNETVVSVKIIYFYKARIYHLVTFI